jgi:hypothetical protein
MARKMPTNPATVPVNARNALTNTTPNGAAIAARSAGLSLNGLSSPTSRHASDSSFPNLLVDALQGADPTVSQALLAGVGADSLTGSRLPSPANLIGTPAVVGQTNANPFAGLANPGTSVLGGALSGLGNLASLFGVGATTTPLSAAQKQSGEKAVETALGYLGRYDWNNYCERFVEVCYGTKNLYPNAATAGRALVTHRGVSALAQAPVGAILYFAANAGNQQQGHAGLYLGDGRMVSATPNGVKMERVDAPAYAGQFLGWAEPGSFGQGRVSASAVANAVGADPRTTGASRSQSVSRLGSTMPPTLPRATGAPIANNSVRAASASGTASPRSTVGSNPSDIASATRRFVTPVSPVSSPTMSPASTAAPGGAAVPPVLPAAAPEAIAARPITSALSVAPPLPLTARAVVGSRAPTGFSGANPLSPLSTATGLKLNQRA